LLFMQLLFASHLHHEQSYLEDSKPPLLRWNTSDYWFDRIDSRPA
jgi:hypothetical protein